MSEPQINGDPPSPEDLVKMLRSKDATTVAKALEEIFPEKTVTMVKVDGGQISMASTARPELVSLFTGLCWASQQIGKGVGMSLNWVADPKDQQKIIVSPGGRLPPG